MSRKATVVFCGLPVDGLKAILKLSGGAELPFADNGPNDCTTPNGCGEYDEDRYSGVRDA